MVINIQVNVVYAILSAVVAILFLTYVYRIIYGIKVLPVIESDVVGTWPERNPNERLD